MLLAAQHPRTSPSPHEWHSVATTAQAMSVPHYAPSIKSLAIKAFGSFSYAIGFPPKEAAL
jgi:hypothetical protein